MSEPLNPDLPRRSFLGLSAVGLAAAAASPRLRPGVESDGPSAADVDERSIPELQAHLSRGTYSSAELTEHYLSRIRALNPTLGAVIEVNPDAVRIAQRRDLERLLGLARGRLHGIPVLIKDNIATDDDTETTAGSFALVGSRVRDDADVVASLRRAGAIILGKANLSEWANFRGGSGKYPAINGWSARGGFTRNPYKLGADPCGSSSGSAVAVAANLCAAAVGTETDGSITCPAGLTATVGLKPTIGLIPQRGIIPISASQDCAGPMARTVTDVAILLAAMQAPAPAAGLSPPADIPRDYLPFLDRNALQGARIGLDPQYDEPDIADALEELEKAGATVIEVNTVNFGRFFFDEFTVLLYEFARGIEDYLATLRDTDMKTLADLRRFNKANCDRELRFFNQSIFRQADATGGDLTDPIYLRALRRCRRLTRDEGLDRAFGKHNLDAIVGSSFTFLSSPAAVAGYPHIAVPAGYDNHGVPAGLSMVGRPWQEGKLLGLAYSFEQATMFRRPPELRGKIRPDPARFPTCDIDRPEEQASTIGHLHDPWHMPAR